MVIKILQHFTSTNSLEVSTLTNFHGIINLDEHDSSKSELFPNLLWGK